MTRPATFNDHIARWKAEQQTPWFRLRYATVQANLGRHLPAPEPQPSLQILDVGGGNGAEALPLAEIGHHVTIVDFSSEMLADARRNAERSGLLDCITIHEADIASLAGLFARETFDVALCHNVLQYVDDPARALGGIAQLIRHGGLLSVVSPNRYGETYVAALLQHDLATALERIDATTVNAALFETPVHRFTGDEMVSLLGAAGFAPAGHYGVLSVCAYIADNELKYDPTFYQQLEQLELALTDRYPYYLVARFFQVVARKNESV